MRYKKKMKTKRKAIPLGNSGYAINGACARKIRRKNTNDDFAPASVVILGTGRRMFKFIDGERKGEILWEEQVEFRKDKDESYSRQK